MNCVKKQAKSYFLCSSNSSFVMIALVKGSFTLGKRKDLSDEFIEHSNHCYLDRLVGSPKPLIECLAGFIPL